MSASLFEQEVGSHPWAELRQASQDWRQDVPAILRALAGATSEGEASAAYYRLEGCCFPQRLATESCVAVVDCLLAALADGLDEGVCGWVLEALRGIVQGEPIEAETLLGNSSLIDDCRRSARAGLWLLLSLSRQLSGPDLENLHEILLAVDASRAER